ncbi:unnamed protein product [Cuscuta epithymum]|uniref:Uncharacterized protein n=1 Tax=Cuscuta epithymum TaxID=186058 RepID=A0AAV0FF81_9ASTE|nr:unnamed protein product [Cuscuta epithymum]
MPAGAAPMTSQNRSGKNPNLDFPEPFVFSFFFLLLKPVHRVSIFFFLFVENQFFISRLLSKLKNNVNLFGLIPTDGASVEFNPTRYSKYICINVYEELSFYVETRKGENHGTF